ncbi:MAG: hypothetical protein A3J35_03215 [Gammaproteobacteria bacterium RIFCSPLOWO2_02_FULL_52_10]|nr:MAG: hypothetical protein A3J35_03215 [Gammaproteobacteria bacterium RIFCSPLOWO2_02_FULL_52_10]
MCPLSLILKNLAAALILAGWLLSGCSAGGGGTVRFYTVNPLDLPAAGGEADDQLAIEILNLHVPEYLERSHIATRDEDNSLHFSEFNQWAENLRKNLMRTMARNLAGLLGTSAISTPLSRSSAVPDYRLEIHIDQFERDSDGLVKLAARWQLITGETSEPLGVHSLNLQSTSPVEERDYGQMAGEMRDLYGQLSRKIADEILAEQNKQPEQ